MFRHFPSKDALFAGLAERAAERFRLTPQLAEDLEQIRQLPGPLFDYFAENRQLLAASRKIPEVAAFGERTRRERARRIEELVSARYPRFGAEQRRAATALLHLVLSAQSWSWLVEAFGLSQARASWAASWAYSILRGCVAGVKRGHWQLVFGS